jgi:mono/diheme cytochrome c family protein
MKIFGALTLSVFLVACGPPPASDAGGGGSADAGSAADAGATIDAGEPVASPTICDLHASNVFAGCIGCHGNAAGVSIDHSSPQSLYDSLVGVSGNSGQPMVVSGDADNSWLWVRMNALQGESSMPPSGTLDSDQLDPIRDWINGGSLNDCL